MELSIGHQRATEGDATDVGAQIRHGLDNPSSCVGVQVRELDHVLGDARENRCQSHQAVEGRHQLRQVCDFNTLGNGEACRATSQKQNVTAELPPTHDPDPKIS